MEVIDMTEYSHFEGNEEIFEKVVSGVDNENLPGSKELYYLVATPTLIHIVIDGASRMLDSRLPSDMISVGTHIELFHELPTLVGEKISIKIKIEKVIKNKVFFGFTGTDSRGDFCRGTYERHIVRKDKLKQDAHDRFPGMYQLS